MIQLYVKEKYSRDLGVCIYETQTLEEMDEYTANSFVNSDDLFKKNKKIISTGIPDVSPDKYFAIVTNSDDYGYRTRPIYKPYKKFISNIMKNPKFVLKLRNAYRDEDLKEFAHFFSDYMYREIGRLEMMHKLQSPSFDRLMGSYNSVIKESPKYYIYVRRLLHFYQLVYKDLGLPKFEDCIQEILNSNKKLEKKTIDKSFVPKTSDEMREYLEYLEKVSGQDKNDQNDDNNFQKGIGRKQ